MKNKIDKNINKNKEAKNTKIRVIVGACLAAVLLALVGLVVYQNRFVVDSISYYDEIILLEPDDEIDLDFDIHTRSGKNEETFKYRESREHDILSKYDVRISTDGSAVVEIIEGDKLRGLETGEAIVSLEFMERQVELKVVVAIKPVDIQVTMPSEPLPAGVYVDFDQDGVEIVSVTFLPDSSFLPVYKAVPEDVTDPVWSFWSSDENIFTVNEEGMISSVNVGEAELVIGLGNVFGQQVDKRLKVVVKNAPNFAQSYRSANNRTYTRSTTNRACPSGATCVGSIGDAFKEIANNMPGQVCMDKHGNFVRCGSNNNNEAIKQRSIKFPTYAAAEAYAEDRNNRPASSKGGYSIWMIDGAYYLEFFY